MTTWAPAPLSIRREPKPWRNYADDSVEYGSFLASFLGLGDNYSPGSEPNAIDGNLATHTTMGNNVDEPGKRLRVTLGFKSSLMPG